MKFSKPLHPEIVLNKRGDKVNRLMYQEWFKLIALDGFSQEGCRFEFALENATTPSLRKHMRYMQHDQVLAKHICLTKTFAESKEKKIYHFGKSLIEDLSKMDKDIPLDLLPNQFLGYISFPPDTIADEAGYCEGGYVGIFASQSLDVSQFDFSPEEKASRVLWMTYDIKGVICSMLLPLVTTKMSGFKLEGHVHDYSMESELSVSIPSETTQELRNHVFRTLFNAVIFLSCKNAELEISRPAAQTGLSNKEIIRRGGVINECTVPVTFVNRGYHGITYSKDSTLVRSHLRFQRCGPAYSQIELVTVKAHQRYFKS